MRRKDEFEKFRHDYEWDKINKLKEAKNGQGNRKHPRGTGDTGQDKEGLEQDKG
jgi:hypothetical protein